MSHGHPDPTACTDPAERARELERRALAASASSRARNREQFPELAEIVDQFRRAFGPSVFVNCARINDTTIRSRNCPLRCAQIGIPCGLEGGRG